MKKTSIGKRMERQRLQRGMSITVLARAAGVSKSLISQLESGVRDGNRTALGMIQKIAQALGVSIDYLAGMYEDDDAAAEDKAEVGI